MKIEQIKTAITDTVDSLDMKLRETALSIHDNPELGFHEEKASRLLTSFLEANGFSLEFGPGGLSTSFKATYGQGSPVVAILAEYDALPELGHACGHNIIGTSAAGAGVAAKKAVDEYGGSVVVIGTPAEELYGGKIVMADQGVFDGLDFAMMVHPGSVDSATTQALACHALEVEFTGKPAHAAAKPEEGINALEAMILSFNGINSLRQHIRTSARIHGIITNGGEAPNIVPAHTAGSFIVRASEGTYLEELKERVIACFKGAAEATGATLDYKWDEVMYLPMLNNMRIARIFSDNMNAIGRDTLIEDPDKAFGSTDMGNVSQIVPSIHAIVSIAEKNVLGHTPEFRTAAASERGMKGLLDAAKAMAMTVADILSDKNVQSEIKDEFMNSGHA